MSLYVLAWGRLRQLIVTGQLYCPTVVWPLGFIRYLGRREGRRVASPAEGRSVRLYKIFACPEEGRYRRQASSTQDEIIFDAVPDADIDAAVCAVSV